MGEVATGTLQKGAGKFAEEKTQQMCLFLASPGGEAVAQPLGPPVHSHPTSLGPSGVAHLSVSSLGPGSGAVPVPYDRHVAKVTQIHSLSVLEVRSPSQSHWAKIKGRGSWLYPHFTDKETEDQPLQDQRVAHPRTHTKVCVPPKVMS